MPDLRLDQPDDDARALHRRTVRGRGIGLAFAGNLVGLVVLSAARGLGLTHVSARQLGALFCGIAGVHLVLFLVARRRAGRRDRPHWDPHFIYTPIATSTGLMLWMVLLAPEVGSLLAMGLFLCLAMGAGYLPYSGLFFTSAIWVVAYLVAITLRSRNLPSFSIEAETLRASTVLVAAVVVNVAFHRLRRERERVRTLTRELSSMAATDSLTGLFNRRLLDATLEAEIVRARRYGNPLSVAILDLDDFKAVNDAWGHPAGDALLQQVGRTIRGLVRETDVVARHGGDEFAVLLTQTSLEGARQTMEKVRSAVAAQEHRLPGVERPVKTTMSIGIAALGDDGGGTGTRVVSAADAALYAAKTAGKNRVEVAAGAPGPPLRPESLRRPRWSRS
jgi:diguanylate cyclase (GGDEF)-like protein